MFYDVTKLKLFGLIDQQYVWCKKGNAYEQKNTISVIKHGPVTVKGVFCCCRKWKVWLYEGHRGFSEVSSQDFRCLRCRDWSLIINGRTPIPIHDPNLLRLYSGIGRIGCSWVASSVSMFNSHWKYLVDWIWRKQWQCKKNSNVE